MTNRGKSDIYFASNPRQVSGRMGYYRIIDVPARNRIILNSQLYPAPPFPPYTDERSVELRRLAPGEEYLDKTVVAKFPISETQPPYDDNRPFIKRSELTEIKVSFGIFPDREASLWVGSKVYGKEKLLWAPNKGKTLLEIQKIVISDPCLVPKS